ncbi:hypothetical protein CXF72_08945 [Psychromonas sp. MB-3u-54]|uniref:hypothetical protein n=1 Tax=Psychromonas sp. MB-3u-54 TaxID=2058319 RepID=UPI000C33119D|nr:hypothetical protein [Psychromonas sp. MB-3u-54]PKH02910.1 hypothetical protein CXF72_08945 [Psychromonas sp. MB-3u-54]
MTELNLTAIRKQLTALNFNADKIKIITVSAMDQAALKNCTSKEDESFYNSYMNVIYRRGERYVLGYRCEDPLVEHAIIKMGDLYFDPTQQANSEFTPYQFAVLTEFKIFDMMKRAKTNKDFPPDVDYLLTKKKHFKNIINSEK